MCTCTRTPCFADQWKVSFALARVVKDTDFWASAFNVSQMASSCECTLYSSVLGPVLVSQYSGVSIHQPARPEQTCIISNWSKYRHDSSFAEQSYHLRAPRVHSMALSFLFLHISLSISFCPSFNAPLKLTQETPTAMTSLTPYLLVVPRLLSLTAASCLLPLLGIKGQGRRVKRTSECNIKQKRAREDMSSTCVAGIVFKLAGCFDKVLYTPPIGLIGC